MSDATEPPLTLKKTFQLGGVEIHALRYGVGANCIHVINRAWEVMIFDPLRRQMRRQYRLPIEAAVCADWSSCGHHLVVGTWHGAEIFDAWTGERIATTPQHINIVSRVLWSRAGGWIAIAAGSIRIWDTGSEKYIASLDGHKHGVQALAEDRDGRLLASADGCGTVLIWDVGSGRLLSKIQAYSTMIHTLAWSADARYLAIPASLRGYDRKDNVYLTVFDFQKGEVAAELPGDYPRVLSFYPLPPAFGNLLLSQGVKSVRIWRMDTWQCVADIPEDSSRYVLVSGGFHPHGNSLLTLSDRDTAVKWWNCNPKVLQALDGHCTVKTDTAEIIDFPAQTPKIATRPNKHTTLFLKAVEDAKTASEKGTALENLCRELFESVTGFKVSSNVKTVTEEIDLSIQKWTKDVSWLDRHAFYVLAECKNWSTKCGKDEYVLFKAKLANRRHFCDLGFLISWNGFAKTIETESLRGSREESVIALVTGEDLREAVKKGNFLEVLFHAYDKAVMR